MDRAFLSDIPDRGTLILVRHGQQEWPDPVNSVTADWVDPPLSDLGRRQADAVGRHLSPESITAVYSSHLLRANDTGRAIAEHHALDVEVHRDLQEIHLYRDLPQDQRAIDTMGEKVLNGVRSRFIQTRRWDAYPHTEGSLEFRRRVGYAIEAAVVSHPGETIVVACHGGVINAYLAEILGLTEDFFFRPVHASVHRIHFSGERRVVSVLNEQHFLDAEGLVTH